MKKFIVLMLMSIMTFGFSSCVSSQSMSADYQKIYFDQVVYGHMYGDDYVWDGLYSYHILGIIPENVYWELYPLSWEVYLYDTNMIRLRLFDYNRRYIFYNRGFHNYYRFDDRHRPPFNPHRDRIGNGFRNGFMGGRRDGNPGMRGRMPMGGRTQNNPGVRNGSSTPHGNTGSQSNSGMRQGTVQQSRPQGNPGSPMTRGTTTQTQSRGGMSGGTRSSIGTGSSRGGSRGGFSSGSSRGSVGGGASSRGMSGGSRGGRR